MRVILFSPFHTGTNVRFTFIHILQRGGTASVLPISNIQFTCLGRSLVKTTFILAFANPVFVGLSLLINFLFCFYRSSFACQQKGRRRIRQVSGTTA